MKIDKINFSTLNNANDEYRINKRKYNIIKRWSKSKPQHFNSLSSQCQWFSASFKPKWLSYIHRFYFRSICVAIIRFYRSINSKCLISSTCSSVLWIRCYYGYYNINMNSIDYKIIIYFDIDSKKRHRRTWKSNMDNVHWIEDVYDEHRNNYVTYLPHRNYFFFYIKKHVLFNECT